MNNQDRQDYRTALPFRAFLYNHSELIYLAIGITLGASIVFLGFVEWLAAKGFQI